MTVNRFLRRPATYRESPPAILLVVLILASAVAANHLAREWRRAPIVPESPAHALPMHLPRVMFWAWERPEDLRFLNPRQAGVAFLAGTIEIQSPNPSDPPGNSLDVVLEPRLQPLEVPPHTPLMAVVRIETPHDLWHHPPGWRSNDATATPTSLYSKAQRNRVVEMILSLAALRGVRALQLDYDATRSEQPFYRQLLETLRRRLPRSMPLSMTALASWCIGDPWLDSLPPGTVAEAVPMLFRMGPDAPAVASFMQSGRAFRARVCRASLGVSTDEAFSQELLDRGLSRPAGQGSPRRIYVFSNRAWTRAQVAKILAEVHRWDALAGKSR